MACSLTGLFRRCFYTGLVGDQNEKPHKPYNGFWKNEKPYNKSNTYGFGEDSEDSSDEEILYKNEKIITVIVEPDGKAGRDDRNITKMAEGTDSVEALDVPSSLEQELVELLDSDSKEASLEYFTMFDSGDSTGPGR